MFSMRALATGANHPAASPPACASGLAERQDEAWNLPGEAREWPGNLRLLSPGALDPSLRMRNCRVDRFMPSRAAAPFGPAITQRCARGRARMWRRSACSSVSARPVAPARGLRGVSAPRPARPASARREDHRALDQVLQLADVARPVVARQRVHRLRRESSRSPSSSAGRTAARSAAPASGCPRARSRSGGT